MTVLVACISYLFSCIVSDNDYLLLICMDDDEVVPQFSGSYGVSNGMETEGQVEKRCANVTRRAVLLSGGLQASRS